MTTIRTEEPDKQDFPIWADHSQSLGASALAQHVKGGRVPAPLSHAF
jgi:hypothetical protein